MTLAWIEQSWKIIAVLALVAAACLVVYRLTERRGALLATLLAVLAAAAVSALDWWVVSPGEQVQALLATLSQAAEKGDAETIVLAISPNYSGEGRNHAGVVAQIRREIGRGDIQSVSLSGVVVEADDHQAVARFVAFIDGSYEGMSAQHIPLRMKLTFAREADGWKITRAQRFAALQKSDEEVPLFSR